jgi:hypothetical protein
MTTTLTFDPLAQFSAFETQVGFTFRSGDSDPARDWPRVEALMAESARALKSGDMARFNGLLDELQKASTPQPKALAVIDAADWIETEPPPLDPIIEGMFEKTDKVALIGSPKLRKSFLALQMALHIAAGRDLLAWKIPKRRKVLLVQMEMKTSHFHRRLKKMTQTLGITRAVIESNLHIVNGRGKTVDMAEIAAHARAFGAEVIIFDPLYKLAQGDENSAQDMKPILAEFDRLAEMTGAAVLYVHHDPKGTPGDRNLRDRGAGSGVISRDYDCCIMMTAHRDDADAVVIEVLQRNYKPLDPFTIGWCEGTFRVADLAAVTAKSGGRTNPTSIKAAEEYCDEAVRLLSRPLSMSEFFDLLRSKLGLTQQKARSVQDAVLRTGKLKQTLRRYGKGGPIFIGKPQEIDEMEPRLREQELPDIKRQALLGRKSCESR